MKCYQEAMRAIERERIHFLNKIDLVQPSIEEQHQLEWGRRYQEEELLALQSELSEVSREVEAETKQLRDREEVVRAIRQEQQQDRIKIQTLLALSQPITPDITVVFQALASDAYPGPMPPASRGARPRRGSSVPPDNREVRSSVVPSHRTGAQAGGEVDAEQGASLECGGRSGARDGRDFWGDEKAVEGQRRVDGDGVDGVGLPSDQDRRGDGGGDGKPFSEEEDTEPEEEEEEEEEEKCSSGCEGEGEGDQKAHREGEAARGASFGLHRGRRWRSETSGTGATAGEGRAGKDGVQRWNEGQAEEECRGVATRRGSPGNRGGAKGWRGAGSGLRRRRRRRSRDADGREGGAGSGGRFGARKIRDANRLRCTRGYQHHLELRLEMTQRHLRELERLEGSYHETLAKDKQEREMQVQAQTEDVSVVVESLRRRTAEVDKRLAEVTDDYLRLRHRAKEAHAVSTAEQRRCAEAREKSHALVLDLLAAAEAEMQDVKEEGRRRLEHCSSGLREKLGAAEEALQEERSHQGALKQRFEDRVARARDAVLVTRRRHHKLMRRRAQEVVHLSDEMSALRRGVTELERRMFQAW